MPAGGLAAGRWRRAAELLCDVRSSLPAGDTGVSG
jgi:hypothetical protein